MQWDQAPLRPPPRGYHHFGWGHFSRKKPTGLGSEKLGLVFMSGINEGIWEVTAVFVTAKGAGQELGTALSICDRSRRAKAGSSCFR